MKICSKCKQEKEQSEFHKNGSKYYASRCKECVNKYNPYDVKRRWHLKKNFGLTEEDYDRILANQGGGCAICGKTCEQEGRKLAIDHDHKTGELFGILCTHCNHRILGKNRDPDKFLKASEYLRKGLGLFVPRKKIRKKWYLNKQAYG